MGMLTEDMTRLRNDVLGLRSARQGLIHDLKRETEDRRADVSQMLADFSKALGAVARRTKADRLGFVSDLKRTVTDLLSEVRTDLCGARQAWLALGATSPRAVEELASRPRLRAGARAERKAERNRQQAPARTRRG